jgi:hypothetical protein
MGVTRAATPPYSRQFVQRTGVGRRTVTRVSSLQTTRREDFQLSPQQVAYFETFGFIRLRGLFANDIEGITVAFERVFEDEQNERMETYDALHGEERRLIVPVFIDRHEKLRQLRNDPRVQGIVQGLIGDNYEYAESDGSLFWCESSWHPDIYGAPLSKYHVKLSFYLDELHGENGAIRVIPGTNHFEGTFARTLLKHFFGGTPIKDVYGVDERDIPSYTVESEPGDVIVWNYRTIHGSYHGGARRRLFSISFRECARDSD